MQGRRPGDRPNQFSGCRKVREALTVAHIEAVIVVDMQTIRHDEFPGTLPSPSHSEDEGVFGRPDGNTSGGSATGHYELSSSTSSASSASHPSVFLAVMQVGAESRLAEPQGGASIVAPQSASTRRVSRGHPRRQPRARAPSSTRVGAEDRPPRRASHSDRGPPTSWRRPRPGLRSTSALSPNQRASSAGR